MNLTLPIADMPGHRPCAAVPVMCEATVKAMVNAIATAIAVTRQTAFNQSAPPGALKNRRSSA